MIGTPFISYVVPCYNVEAYLPRCINSLRIQKIKDVSDVELILVNDGSTDNTLSVLRDFAASEERAIIINQTNLGVSAARNAGLRVAKGKYVFFLDSDDWLTDDASQILFDVCGHDEPDIIVTNAYIVKEEMLGNKQEWNPCRGISPGSYGTMEFADGVYRLPISFKAYRRELLINNNVFFNELLRVGEVYAFFLSAMVYSHAIAFTDKRIMNYLVRHDSVMRTINVERDSTIVNTIHYIDDCVCVSLPELRESASYINSLYDISNMFGVYNYIGKSPYSSDIGKFLKRMIKDDIYLNCQRFVIFRNGGCNKRTLYALLFYFFPVSLAYRLSRFVRMMKKSIS